MTPQAWVGVTMRESQSVPGVSAGFHFTVDDCRIEY
jgi:hypothetical protein